MYTHIFTDSEILELIDHPKSLPYNWRGIARAVSARSKIVQTVKVISDSDFSFELKLNQNQINFRKFSLILGFYKPDILNKLFHLRRYDNGHGHTNSIEGNFFSSPHIHTATERYQRFAFAKEDGFAEITDRFITYEEALLCLFSDWNIKVDIDPQLSIFGDYNNVH